MRLDCVCLRVFLVITAVILKNVLGFFINIDANEEQCFFDRVNAGAKMSLMFEVAEGGFLDIDVKVVLLFFRLVI